MNEVTLPPSPNWYLSNILACAKDGTIAWGARNVIVVGRCKQGSKILQYSIINNAHTDRVTSLAFSPDFGETSKSLLVSGGDEHIVRIWDLDSMSAILAYAHGDVKQKVIAIDWSRKSPNFICCVISDGSLISWNISSNTHQQISLGKVVPTCISCCPHEENLVVVGSKSGLIYIIDLRKLGTIVYKLRGHDAEIVSLSWCPVDTNILNKTSNRDLLLASGAKDRSVFIWRAGGDGRYQIEISLPSTPLDSHQHRSKLNSTIGNWTAVCWIQPNILLASSSWGELIAWDLSIMTKNKPHCKLIHACHTRGLFCIANLPHIPPSASENWRIENSVTVWTLAQDRQIICCNVRNKGIDIEYAIPTQGGYVFCISPCPLDTSHIAFGVGDSMLRLWNLSEPHEKSFNVTMLWQKIKGKVRAISWHPEKENLLAFGTNEGRVGVFDTNSIKPPVLYRQYHRKTVYSLGWGPAPENNQYVLYSCAEGELVHYNPNKVNEEPKSILKKECAEFSWKPDFSCLAVGRENGVISFFNRNLQDCGHSIHSMEKTVHCLVWHPESTATDLTISPMCNYLAVAFEANTITVFDLSYVINSLKDVTKEKSQESKQNGEDLNSMHKIVATLTGHTDVVICLAWSPHFSGHLISGSFDNTVQVWKVETQELMATYKGHCAPVYCCMWSPLDPAFIITGSADFTLSIWKLSEHSAIMPTKKAVTKKSRSKKNKQKRDTQINRSKNVIEDVNSVTLQTDLKKDSNNITAECSPTVDANALVEKMSTPKETKRKKPERGSYFPNYFKTINEKSTILNTINNFTRSIKESGSDVPSEQKESNDNVHSFLSYSEDLSDIISNERQSHISQGKFNIAAEMDVWCNNLKQTLEEALKEKRLNDFLISLAPSLSIKMWKDLCEAYANQLIMEGNPHKAVSYLLCIHKTYQAVETFIDAKLYKEAYILAKCKLDADDPLIKKVLQEWADYNSLTGQFEQASLCYVKCGDLSTAAKFLARRKDPNTLETAADLAFLSGDDAQAKSIAEEAVTQALLNSESSIAEQLTTKFPQIKHRKIHVKTFMEVQKLLQKTVEYHLIESWLEDKSEYGILQIFGGDSEDRDFYSSLSNCMISALDENENLLWVHVAHHIALAVTCDIKEKKLRHLTTALNIISQYETEHKVRLENRGHFLILILSHLDIKSPLANESIFSKENEPISKSLRAYLCLGLLNWIVDDLNESEISSNMQIIIELIQDLLEDALDKKTVRYWCTTSEINKLEASLASALSDKQKAEGDDAAQDTAMLLGKLNMVKSEKRNFIDERICSPNPVLVYSKGNALISKLNDESMKNKFTEILTNTWKTATS